VCMCVYECVCAYVCVYICVCVYVCAGVCVFQFKKARQLYVARTIYIRCKPIQYSCGKITKYTVIYGVHIHSFGQPHLYTQRNKVPAVLHVLLSTNTLTHAQGHTHALVQTPINNHKRAHGHKCRHRNTHTHLTVCIHPRPQRTDACGHECRLKLRHTHLTVCIHFRPQHTDACGHECRLKLRRTHTFPDSVHTLSATAH
jgi:hypothetical protein